MEYVLLVYGGAFVATGFALGVQARAAVGTEQLPNAALWAVTLFALVHGASEWADLGVFLEGREHGALDVRLAFARLVLLAVSFAILAAFGLLLARERAPGTVAAAALWPAAAFAAWAAWAALAWGRDGGIARPGAFAAAEGATRYALGVPACLAAVVGLRRLRQRMTAEQLRTARYLGAASIAMGAYGVFTGLVVPASGLALARTLNATTFAAATGVPVQLLRAASIALIGLLLSEVFVRTTTEHLQKEVEHLRDEFISLVAHDLRTPLGTIESGVVLLDRLGREEHGTEREARILRAIRASLAAMNKMVSDLLDASRIQSRRLALSPERIDLTPLLLRLVEWAPPEAMRGHTVRLVPPGPLPPVTADPVRVEQVLANLLSNAGKYSPPGTEIVLEARVDAAEIAVSVTNAGEGIPARDLPLVFARNYRTRAARAGRAQGLGLGLYIAKGLVEAQGGRIWATSEPGARTTFAFTLPSSPPVAPGARAPDARLPPPRARRARLGRALRRPRS